MSKEVITHNDNNDINSNDEKTNISNLSFSNFMSVNNDKQYYIEKDFRYLFL